MTTIVTTPKQALTPAFLKQPPNRKEIELFKKEFTTLLDRINAKEGEEFHKNLIKDFLNAVYYKDKHYINTKDRADLVIHNDNRTTSSVGVLIETKSPVNKAEMVCRDAINRVSTLNVKSFQELVLYYLRERKTGKNFELRYLIITNVYEWFVFDAQDFEKLFYQNKTLLNRFEQFRAGKLSGTTTDFFYKEIAAPEIEKVQNEIPFTYFNIRDYENIVRSSDKKDDKQLIALYHFLSPNFLLKIPFEQDANSLNTEFYAELLHILGLEEVKRGGQKFIERKKEGDRNSGSIIENAIERIEVKNKWDNVMDDAVGTGHVETRLIASLQFDVALDLAITWINRILFLKLLESQILKYHNGNRDYAFLSWNDTGGGRDAINRVSTYTDLDTLFFSVLARKEEERTESIKRKFEHVPYLNSSLFEMTDMENKTIGIDSLRDDIEMELYAKSVLAPSNSPKGGGQFPPFGGTKGGLPPLEYLLRFLDAYDFSSEGAEDIQEENKPLISASVLGLIFEKINGYKDGSFFTPSFITMYMCRETIGRAVIQKFVETRLIASLQSAQSINDLHNLIPQIGIERANEIFNQIRICDPAVGSGHFLVSALNEMIYLKSALGI
ncbi:MAG: class I SAM-dependent DNA methyltransferase, partial [Bacteroidales bacterium]|nr:class I SAM-dependent DNA methyltransferase [Bacteroidales bacterium]